jgi:hypothetical protein
MEHERQQRGDKLKSESWCNRHGSARSRGMGIQCKMPSAVARPFLRFFLLSAFAFGERQMVIWLDSNSNLCEKIFINGIFSFYFSSLEWVKTKRHHHDAG